MGELENSASAAGSPRTTLAERLQLGKDEDFDPVPALLLRKYVAYARKYVHPKMSPEAATTLQQVRVLI